MSELETFLVGIADFSEATHVEKIKIFGWYLQDVGQNQRFSGTDILRCYDEAGLQRPANISQQLLSMCSKQPPDLLRDGRGYRLERRVLNQLDARFKRRDISLQISKLIKNLPTKISSLSEKNFLDEALVCYEHGAFRAAIVMTWNLGYSHFCEWLLSKHLAAFNAQWPVRFPDQHKKSKVKSITSYDHFGELKESEVIDIARSACLITQGVHKTLSEKLGKRNTAAHPSNQSISQLQAEEFIHDLIQNVVLAL